MRNKNTKEDIIKKHLHILVCLEHYNPLGIIRSLGESGINPIAIIIRSKYRFIGTSKYLYKKIYVNDIHEAVKVLFEQYGHMEIKPFLYITDDWFLEYVDSHYNDFKESFITTNAGENGRISYYMNKDNINAIAEKHGMNIPKSEVVRKGVLPTSLKYPVITKAIASTSGAWKEDSFICKSEEELKVAYQKIKGDTLLLQEFIDRAGEFNIDAVSVNHGNSIFLSMVTKYVYLVPGRYSNYHDVFNPKDEQLNDKLKNIIKEIGYEGIFDGEFMIGKDGKIYFLEVNFRPNAFNYASTCAGMNCPYLWAKGMLEGYINEKECYKEIPQGFRAMVETMDFRDRVKSKNVSIFKWLVDFVNCNCYFYFNIRDMKPFIAFMTRKRK